MKFKLSLLLIFLFGSITAQNLILNPSFEDYANCPKSLGNFHDNVTNWSCSNYGSTDYFNNCSNELGFFNYVGNQEPNTGNGYAGIYTFAPNSYREYIQTELALKLVKDIKYTLSFYISLADCSSHSIKNFGVLFTSQKLDSKSKDFIHLKYLERDTIKYTYSTIIDKNFYSNTQTWTKITLEYTATGFEKFITIGNFNTNRKIETKQVWSTAERQFAYYYIDDVTLVESTLVKEPQTIIKKKVKVEAASFEPEKTYTFKNVLFAFDKANLLSNAIEELDKLYFHLKENKSLTIEIYGHTDNVGLVTRNTELSLQRAKAVSNYLINKGLNTERIQHFGFGSSQPLLENISEEKRAINRRVEFKLFNKK